MPRIEMKVAETRLAHNGKQRMPADLVKKQSGSALYPNSDWKMI
jgi:hypothetical protein